MKILVLENEPSSRRGGQEWCLLEVCSGLAQRGHEIYLVYNKDGDFITSYRKFCKSLIKVPCFRIDYGRLKRITSSIAWLTSLLRVLKIRPDVIYINQYQDSLFGGTLAQLKGLPFVCHLHIPPPKGNYFRGQYLIGLKSVTRFIAVSESTRTSYLRTGFEPKTIEVVYNGVDLKRFVMKDDKKQTRHVLDLPLDAFVVLYAGRIDRPKNIEMLIQAFAQLGLSAERARLLIAGGPLVHATQEAGVRYIHELKDLCNTLNISSSVHWLGRRADLPELFRAADVSVLPSMQPDTFGRTLVESMACGTPALGLRFGGIPEVLSGEFEKFQIKVGDICGLTNLLKSLDGWQQNDPTLGHRCRTYVEENFPVEGMVMGVERVLKQAVTLGAVRLGPSPETLKPWCPDLNGI